MQTLRVLKLAIALCYLALGIFLLVKNEVLSFLPSLAFRIGLGVLVMIYGAFRLYRFYEEGKE